MMGDFLKNAFKENIFLKNTSNKKLSKAPLVS